MGTSSRGSNSISFPLLASFPFSMFFSLSNRSLLLNARKLLMYETIPFLKGPCSTSERPILTGKQTESHKKYENSR